MYSALKISEESRDFLLEYFPPKFPDVICHHVTVQFPIKPDSVRTPMNVNEVKVVGHIVGDGVECFVIEVDGTIKRPDGKIFHVTHSIDRESGKKPHMSNELLASLPEKELTAGIEGDFLLNVTFDIFG